MSATVVPAGAHDAIAAIAPVTCGVAIDVPLNTAKPVPGTDDSMLLPGASTSTVSERLENPEMLSASVVEPTVKAVDIHPGDPIAAGKLSFPAAITVVPPAVINWSIMALSAALSVSQAAAKLPPPRLMFAAAIFRAAARVTTHACRQSPIRAA